MPRKNAKKAAVADVETPVVEIDVENAIDLSAKAEVIAEITPPTVAGISETNATTEELRVASDYRFDIPTSPSILEFAGNPDNTGKMWAERLKLYRDGLQKKLDDLRGEQLKNFDGIRVWAGTLVDGDAQKNLVVVGEKFSGTLHDASGLIEATMWAFVRAFSTGVYHGLLKKKHTEALEAAKKARKKRSEWPSVKGLFDFFAERNKGLQNKGTFGNEKLTGVLHTNALATDNSGKMARFADTLFDALECINGKSATTYTTSKGVKLLESQSKFTGIPEHTLCKLVHSAMLAIAVRNANSAIENAETSFNDLRNSDRARAASARA